MTQEINLGDDDSPDGHERPAYCDAHCECIEGRGYSTKTCTATSPDKTLSCTRPEGHDGPHSGCGIDHDEHPMGTWGDDE